jgi:hypothetical protein
MKITFSVLQFAICGLISFHLSAQIDKPATANDKKLFIDVHQLEPGKVKFSDVAAAHAKDLAVEKQYDVHFINYWVDEEKGRIYCLSSAPDTSAVRNTHAKAHGLLPVYTYEVTDGPPAAIKGDKKLFLDIHNLGAGNVTAAAVVDAHQKDLAVQKKYGVNFVNYWVDEIAGVVLCLSEAKNANAVINTHKEAHGLIPAEVRLVKQGE